MSFILGEIPIAVINTMTESNLEKKGFNFILHLCPSSREVRAETQELGDRNKRRSYGTELLTGMFSHLSYRIQNHQPHPGMAPQL